MNIPSKENIRTWSFTGLLVILIGWSAASQTVFLSSLDKAKQAVSRWPWASSPHVQFAINLFESGSTSAYKELTLAQQLPLQNWENISLAKDIIQKPENAKLQIKILEKLQQEKYYSPEITRRLALLNLTIYEDSQAQKYLKKMEYLDPQGEPTKQLAKIISSFLAVY